MSNLKFFYVKLSCPKQEDNNKFSNLFEHIFHKRIFNFELENIPNNLDNANKKDIIFIHIGGDSSNKRRYFKDNKVLNNYTNGIYSIGVINSINSEAKSVSVSLIGLEKHVTKEDLYFFPQFINNLGASTKGIPNQAGLYELKEGIALSLIEYFRERNLISKDLDIIKNLEIKDKLFSKALSEYNSKFSEKKLTQKIFQKYTNQNSNFSNRNNLQVIEKFVKWFEKSENYKLSYKGIVNRENLYFWDQTYFNNQIFNIDINNKQKSFSKIKNLISNNSNKEWLDFNASSSKGAPKAVLGEKNYLKFLQEFITSSDFEGLKLKFPILEKFNINKFISATKDAGLNYNPELITRYIASLATKPFVLLSGLSGSGKTKLAQAFAQWICESEEQYCIVPVGADWTNREPLLGYVNALENTEYILPENGALNLIIKANNNPKKPYFLILDEMNLSHVERYFADFLSVMESNDTFKLHSSEKNLNNNENEKYDKLIEVPKDIGWPKNLFVVGTVNIDETTYMFSPKVLDRANVIEFRVTEDDLENYFKPETNTLDMKKLWVEETKKGLGAEYGEDFVKISIKKTEKENLKIINDELIKFFNKLQIVGSEFGYRTASEIQTLFGMIDLINPDYDKSEDFLKTYSKNYDFKIDVAIMQKLLPKIHGSRRKLSKPLKLLAALCLTETIDNIFKEDGEINITTDKIKYPLSFYKIARMYKNAIENGFASYAEA
ncbi:McrB family protein [Polaribacter sp. KT 15]|uniref:McrB family protein n=1 Tax=Polaribacter sp. KT 15 TaxID=1896175 RepID=UPI000909735C|nr:hypothetical protein [Polaribacter sp. KT 15]SHM75899.1 hypothetical protein SAMN05720268_0401 [Polaribacter sp. KT 15]